MENDTPYAWQFDDEDDDGGFNVTAFEDEQLDLQSLFNFIGEKSRGDSSEVKPLIIVKLFVFLVAV